MEIDIQLYTVYTFQTGLHKNCSIFSFSNLLYVFIVI